MISEPNENYCIIHTDGSIKGPKKSLIGGWAAVIRVNGDRIEISGPKHNAKNIQQMEMEAMIRGIGAVPDNYRGKIFILSDSEIVIKGMNEESSGRIQRGYKSTNGTQMSNTQQWKKLDRLNFEHEIHWFWTHSIKTNLRNQEADELARRARENISKTGPLKRFSADSILSNLEFLLGKSIRQEIKSLHSAFEAANNELKSVEESIRYCFLVHDEVILETRPKQEVFGVIPILKSNCQEIKHVNRVIDYYGIRIGEIKETLTFNNH